MGCILHHITPLVINSLGGRHTHTHTNTHTDNRGQSNSKKPGCGWRVPGLKFSKNDSNRYSYVCMYKLANWTKLL